MKKNRGKWEGSIVSSEAGTMRGAHEYLLTEGKNEGIKKLKKKKRNANTKNYWKITLTLGPSFRARWTDIIRNMVFSIKCIMQRIKENICLC